MGHGPSGTRQVSRGACLRPRFRGPALRTRRWVTAKAKIKPVSTGLWSRYGNPIMAPHWLSPAPVLPSRRRAVGRTREVPNSAEASAAGMSQTLGPTRAYAVRPAAIGSVNLRHRPDQEREHAHLDRPGGSRCVHLNRLGQFDGDFKFVHSGATSSRMSCRSWPATSKRRTTTRICTVRCVCLPTWVSPSESWTHFS